MCAILGQLLGMFISIFRMYSSVLQACGMFQKSTTLLPPKNTQRHSKDISKNAEVVGPVNSFDTTLLCAILAPKWVECVSL